MTLQPLTILAFGFGSLSMLGWLAAAAAPLVIHLWNRRRYREVSWAAIEFLLEALKKNSRRLQFEQWLLLAIRTLIILLVVLALAEPYLNRVGLPLVAGEPTHRMIVIDGSFSMGYRPTDQSRFERAKELASTIVDESRRGDGLSFLLMASPPRAIIASPAFEPRAVLEEIDNLVLPHTEADLLATLDKIKEVLDRVEKETPRLHQHEIYLLTDLQRVTWLPGGREKIRDELRRRGRELSERATLTVIDLGQDHCDNLAVTRLTTTDPLATVARDVVFETQVHNFGRQRRAAQLVELYVDGRRAGEETVDLEPGDEAVVTFSYRFDTGGDHGIEARISGDPLDVDNHRWLSLTVKQSIRVLCVNGKPAGAGFRGATDYLEVALAPSGDSQRGLIRPEVVPESALVELDLDAYDCIFLANVGQFTENEARLLHAYLQRGGGLVFFLGDQVEPASYNRFLADEGAADRKVLPVRLGEVAAEGHYWFDPLGYRHPTVRDFRGREKAGLLTTPVSRYIRLIVPEGSPARVAIGFTNGDPAVVEQSIGRGRSTVVATSADTSWTSMPVWPSYLPIVQNLLKYSLGSSREERNVEVGHAIGSSRRAGVANAEIVLQTPSGDQTTVRLEPEGGINRWQYAGTRRSGFYVAEPGPSGARRELYAVNVNTRESDLTKLSAEQLRQDVWPGVPLVHQTTWQDFSEHPSAEVSRRATLHRMLLYTALGLLFLETLLAWRFGSRMA